MSRREPPGFGSPYHAPRRPMVPRAGRTLWNRLTIGQPSLRRHVLPGMSNTPRCHDTADVPPSTKETDDSLRSSRRDRGFSRRSLIVTLVVSLGLHAAAVAAILLLLRGGVPVVDSPDKPTEVELVMEERKGDLRPDAAPTPPAPPTPPTEQSPPEVPAPTETKVAPPPVEAPDEALPNAPQQDAGPVSATNPQPPLPRPAAATPAQEAKSASPPPPPAAQTAPTISLLGTDSPSNARAFGDRIIPASPAAVFHNRPPVYPEEAAANGQHGTVVVLIHVSPAGTAAGVDLVRSSGYVLLDRSASEAVRHWRFLPAVKDGQPVASDMTMGFIFDDQ
jgi:protein TonB